jgi:hypothetical protein
VKHTVVIVARRYPFTPKPTVTTNFNRDCTCAEALVAVALAMRPGIESMQVRHADGELCPLFVEAQQEQA